MVILLYTYSPCAPGWESPENTRRILDFERIVAVCDTRLIWKKRRKGEYYGTPVSTMTNPEEKPVQNSSLMPFVPSRVVHHLWLSASLSKLVYNLNMRTSVTLEDQVHEFASVYASARGITLSAAINELIRKAQATPSKDPEISRGPNGLPMFPPTGRTITAEMVKNLEAEEL